MQPITQERIDDLVYRQLLDNIKTNVWKSGEKLPSENELCVQLNVSRISVRAAIQRLKSIGLVESRRGREPSSAPTTTCLILRISRTHWI